MKTLLTLLALAATLSFAQAQNTVVVPLTANVVSNLLSTPRIVSRIDIAATTANATTVKFYDASTATTSMVQAATTRYESYATNYTVAFTNSSGIIVSNSFKGVYTAPVAVALSTNERPKVLTVVVPASSSLSLSDLQLQSLRGLTAVPTHAATVTVYYRNIQ